MITISFILENHFSTIQNCLLALEPILELVSSYNIHRSQPEDMKTKDYISTWAKNKKINEIKKIDESGIVFYIYGNEKLIINSKIKFDLDKKYSVKVICEDYEEVQTRINGFLEDTNETIDIVLEKFIEDPVEISRRAINKTIYNLDNKLEDYLETAYCHRKSGNLELAKELLEKYNSSKSFKYYNELILSSNKDAKYIYEFVSNYKCLESYYYLLELLIKNNQYDLAYEQLRLGYNIYNNINNSISIRNIKNKYNEIALIILLKLAKYQELINIKLEINDINDGILELINKLYNVNITNKSQIVLNRGKTLLDSGISVNYEDKIGIIIPSKDLILDIPFSNPVDNYTFVLGKEITLFYNNIQKNITKEELILFVKQPLNIQKLFLLNENISINSIEKLKEQLVYVDIMPTENSIKIFLEHLKYNSNMIYLGISLGLIDSSFNKLLDSKRYLMISNSPIGYLYNTQLVLDKIGLDINQAFIIKLVKSNNYLENSDRIVSRIISSELHKTFLVNLKEREDRLKHIQSNLSGLLEIERIDAVKAQPGWVGCFKSHQRCLRIAKKENRNTCLVIEDDCELFRRDSFIKEWNEVKNWLDSNMDKWDVYLGGCTNLRKEHIHEYLNKELGILRLEFSTTTHFTYYNKSIFSKIIDYNVNPKKYTPLDLVIPEVAKGRIVTKVPYLAKQKADYSDIEGRVVDYDQMFKDAEKVILENVKEPIIPEPEKIIISPILMGGLGNRMFQIASALGLAEKQNKKLLITNDLQNSHSNQDYFKTIFRKVQKEDKNIENIFKEPDDKALTYIDIPNTEYNLRLFGYFQNENYFNNSKDKVLEIFSIEPERLDKLNKKYLDVSDRYFIHIRKGDFINNPVHNLGLDKYYSSSLEFIKQKDNNAKYYVFSDDIERCKKDNFLQDVNIEYINEEDEVDSLYLMSLCKKGGIGCNSTFSWWGGYLNTNKDKLVVYPKKWLNNETNNNIGWKGSYSNDNGEILIN